MIKWDFVSSFEVKAYLQDWYRGI